MSDDDFYEIYEGSNGDPYDPDAPGAEPEGRYSEPDQARGPDVEMFDRYEGGGCGCEKGCTCPKCTSATSGAMTYILIAIVIIVVIVVIMNLGGSTETAVSNPGNSGTEKPSCCGDSDSASQNAKRETKQKEIGFMQRLGQKLRGN